MRGQIQQAILYAREAILLFRKHPSLFFVPLIMGVFGQVETRVGTYLADHHTGWGHDYNEYKTAQNMRYHKNARSKEIQLRLQLAMRNIQWAMLGYVPRPPEFNLNGSMALLEALSYGHKQDKEVTKFTDLKRSYFLTFYLGTFSQALIGAITGAGYLFILWNVITSHEVRWRKFLSLGWRIWLRFLIYTSASLFLPFGLTVGLAIVSPSWILLGYIFMLLGILFALTQFILVVDRMGIVKSLRLSAQIIWHNFLTALLLIVFAGAFILLGLKLSPTYNRFLNADWSNITSSISHLPQEALLAGIYSIVAAWYSAAMLIWYHDIKQCEMSETIKSTS